MALPTYDQFVTREAAQIDAAYRAAHGHAPGASDLYHTAWRRLVEGWSHASILKDIVQPGTGGGGWTPGHEPVPTTGPMRVGFLLRQPYGYGYPAWRDAQRAEYRAWMRGLGLTHLPFAPWCSDPRGGEYDLRSLPDEFRAICQELLADSITPIVMGYCGDYGAREWSRSRLTSFWAGYAPMLSGLPVEFAWGWEINDVNEWARQGEEQGEWARALHRLTGRKIWAHWTPERWAGWPDYGSGDSDRRSEYAWWAQYGPALAGILYQEPFDKPEAGVIERAFQIPAPHNYRPGIAGRIVDGCRSQFVLFETTRGDLGRWQRLAAVCQQHSDVCAGWAG